MKNLMIFLVIFILALLESTIIPLNLTLVAVISWAALKPPGQGLVIAFLAGIFLDLLTGIALGLTSLAFLFLILPIYLYKNRFQADKLRFLLPYSFLAVFALNFLHGLPSLFSVVFGGVSTVVLLPIFRILAIITQEETQPKLSF